jgi:translation initiation factor 1A
MPKNTIGGKGHKKSKTVVLEKKNVPYKEDGTDYAFVIDALGNGRLKVFCFEDKQTRIAHIRGSMYKKVWIVKDDVILISLRSYEDKKCDVIYKYDQDDIKFLTRLEHIDKNYINVAKGDVSELLVTDNNDDIIVFDDNMIDMI